MENRQKGSYLNMILETNAGINDKDVQERKVQTNRQVILCLPTNIKKYALLIPYL